MIEPRSILLQSDTIRRYDLFVPGEPVYVTEKIHGECMRVTFHDGRIQVGSRDEWKKQHNDIIEKDENGEVHIVGQEEELSEWW